MLAPWSAAHPYVNLYTMQKPAVATVSGNYQLTAEDASCDIRHIVLDFGGVPMPVPIILGHEGAGTVLEVGKEVSRVKTGDQVIASFIPKLPATRPPPTPGRSTTRL